MSQVGVQTKNSALFYTIILKMVTPPETVMVSEYAYL